jgi:DNA-binding LacI/PurR family transcriptional regulator
LRLEFPFDALRSPIPNSSRPVRQFKESRFESAFILKVRGIFYRRTPKNTVIDSFMSIKRNSKQRATISDVARLAGVSISTVSRVVNDTAPVSDDVVTRVRQAIEMLSYTPHAAARNLAVKRTNAIGLLLPAVTNAFVQPTLMGIEQGIADSPYDLLICLAKQHPGLHNQSLPVGEHNTDGLLIFSTYYGETDILTNYQRGFPMVLLHRIPPKGTDIPAVLFDNQPGVRQLIDHLIEVHGRRRIVFLHGPVGNDDSTAREQAYRESLLTHKIPYDPNLIERGDYNELGGREAIHRMLADGVHFDAVFCGDDEAATGVMDAIRQAGRRVPEDVSIVGFDDVTVARHLNPPLTTVRAPIQEAGRLAVRVLLALLSGEPVKQQITLLPVEAVIR